MTKAAALELVNAELERIEFANAGKELRPWERNACLAALEHWGRVQQRIALTRSRGKERRSGCLREFHYWP